MDERIRWAQKVKQSLIWRLYQMDALGILDEELIEKVGAAFAARCHSVLLVSNAQVECPRCGTLIELGRSHTHTAEDVITCPTGCGWSATRGQYHNSWHHQDLIGTRAEPAFRRFIDAYHPGLPPNQKMLLIDGLIQAFHEGIIADIGHRSAANNLIEGSHEQVVAFLERLAGDENINRSRTGWQEWLERARTMQQARKGAHAE